MSLSLKAIIGLGNPGSRYLKTRHNVGFEVVENLAQQESRLGQSARWEEKCGCKFLRQNIAQASCLLILPQQFMNRSGETVVPLLRFFKIASSDIVVIHDDLDLAPGVLRVKQGGSSGGHRGVEDIIRHLGDDNFFRIRIGIGHPHRGIPKSTEEETENKPSVSKEQREKEVTAWVLKVPRGEEQKLLQGSVEKAGEAVRVLFLEGLEATQQRMHRAN